MQRFLSLAVSAGLLAATSSTYAQVGPELTVEFSPLNAAVSAAPVPLGPFTVILSILAIATMIAYASRKGKKHWLSLPVVAALVGIGMSQPSSTQALPASITIPLVQSPEVKEFEASGYNSFTLINNKTYAIRLDSIEVSPSDLYVLQTVTPQIALRAGDESIGLCIVGMTLQANQSCFGTIVGLPG